MISSVGGVDDPAILAAAILHDTVEDTETTIDEIIAVFGENVGALVAAVTDDKQVEKAERKRLQLQVVNAPGKTGGAKLIKLADKISNVREIGSDPPGDWSSARQLEYFAWAEEVVAALGNVNAPLERLFARTLRTARES